VVFEEALKQLRAYLDRFEEVRRRALKSLPKQRAVCLDVVFELLTKTLTAVRTVAAIEEHAAVSSGVKGVCGGAFLTLSQSESSFTRLKPLRSVSYDPARGAVRISYGGSYIEITRNSIDVNLEGVSRSVNYLDTAELANNAAEYVAVLNRAKVLVELLLPSLTSCAKVLGVKL
jgi:hypothetical protein